jgi:hypothetical protein
MRTIAVVTALFGTLLVVAAGLGGTASGAQLSPTATTLKVGLAVTPRTATRGKTVTFVLRVTNPGAAPARLLRVCYQMPNPVTPPLVMLSAPAGFVRGHSGTWCRRFASLPAHGTVLFTFRLRVSTTARGGVATSTGYARASGMESFVFAQAPLTIGVLGPCGRPSAC